MPLELDTLNRYRIPFGVKNPLPPEQDTDGTAVGVTVEGVIADATDRAAGTAEAAGVPGVPGVAITVGAAREVRAVTEAFFIQLAPNVSNVMLVVASNGCDATYLAVSFSDWRLIVQVGHLEQIGRRWPRSDVANRAYHGQFQVFVRLLAGDVERRQDGPSAALYLAGRVHQLVAGRF